MSGPDFICIGPVKTGTTWFYQQINRHPSVKMPPVKEVRYFWERAFLSRSYVVKRFFNQHWHYASMREYLGQALRGAKGPWWESSMWTLRYFLLPHSDKWYVRQMTGPVGLISGDVSPNYYQLPLVEIEHIRQILPRVKIIIFLRDPIERTWSLARMVLLQHQGRSFADITDAEFERVFQNEFCACPSYVNMINRWYKVFGQSQVHVGHYEALGSDPSAFMQAIARFLEIDPAPFAEPDMLITRRLNEGKPIDLPPAMAHNLAVLFHDMIVECDQAGYPYAPAWRLRAENLLNAYAN